MKFSSRLFIVGSIETVIREIYQYEKTSKCIYLLFFPPTGTMFLIKKETRLIERCLNKDPVVIKTENKLDQSKELCYEGYFNV